MRSVSQWFAAFGSAARGARRVGRVTVRDPEGGITHGRGLMFVVASLVSP